MPTSAIRSMACLRASRLPSPWWQQNTSPICRPTVNTGLREVMGSWKIMEIRLPRMHPHLLVGQGQQVPALEQDAPG